MVFLTMRTIIKSHPLAVGTVPCLVVGVPRGPKDESGLAAANIIVVDDRRLEETRTISLRRPINLRDQALPRNRHGPVLLVDHPRTRRVGVVLEAQAHFHMVMHHMIIVHIQVPRGIRPGPNIDLLLRLPKFQAVLIPMLVVQQVVH